MLSLWLDWVKKYFIPGEQNEHQPYFLREGMVGLLIVLIVLVEAAVIVPSFFVLPSGRFLTAVIPETLVDLTNQTRVLNRWPALTPNSLLDQAAQLQAEDLAQGSYFAPESPTGDLPSSWLLRAGYDYAVAGEQLAVNFFDTQDVVEAWSRVLVKSPGTLQSQFTEIGVGVAAGRYQGRNTLFAVEFFGRPRSSLAPVETDWSAPTPRLHRVIGAAVAATRLSYWEILATRLHTISSRIFLALLALAILAFSLNFFVNIKIQQPHIVVNALLLIIVLFTVLFINDQIFTGKLQTTYQEILSPVLG